MVAVTICRDYGAQENKICHCFHFSPSCLPWSYRIRCRIFPLLRLLSHSLGPHGLQPAKLFYPWDFSRQQCWSGLPFPSPGGSFWPRDQTRVSSIAGRFFTIWTTNRWGNNGNSERLYFLGSKITADGYCSHEIKTCLLLGRKVMIKLGSVLKSRDITLLTKVHLVKAMVFPVVMYGCESWTMKKAEHRRIDASPS